MDKLPEEHEKPSLGMPEEALQRIQDPNLIRRYMSGGKTFQEILGYSENVMEGFYRTARNLFLTQKYEEAIEAFTFLATLNPHVVTYWIGIAMADQMLGFHEKALIAYGIAVTLQPKNPVVHYHTASCFRALGNIPEAIGALEITIACAEESDEHLELAASAQKVLDSLSEK